jgi:hypothetical protein
LEDTPDFGQCAIETGQASTEFLEEVHQLGGGSGESLPLVAEETEKERGVEVDGRVPELALDRPRLRQVDDAGQHAAFDDRLEVAERCRVALGKVLNKGVNNELVLPVRHSVTYPSSASAATFFVSSF